MQLLNKYICDPTHKFFTRIAILYCCVALSCNKLVEAPHPVNTITTEQAFIDSASAESAISGIYSAIGNSNGNASFATGTITTTTGLYSDELIYFYNSETFRQFYSNRLLADNDIIFIHLWKWPYQYIYQINSSLEALNAAAQLSVTQKNKLISECKFLRAFCYFYLTNLFGSIPYIATGDWRVSQSIPNISQSEVYIHILRDLQESIQGLPDDYQMYNNEKVRATRYAAYALLTRVYLFQRKWTDAVQAANKIINQTNIFDLEENLNDVFKKNSKESILQWFGHPNYAPHNATIEGATFVPYSETQPPFYHLSESLLGAFQPNDNRKNTWTKSTTYEAKTYFFPFKYKVGPAESRPGIPPTEYYTVFRLAEILLIRAEANANLNNITESRTDINKIRRRSGLEELSFQTQNDAVIAVRQERRCELFAEWGHRWFDLKRSDSFNEQMQIISQAKGATWKTTAALYPIPIAELRKNPFLRQNPGY
ncbi:RagB/SusD family nutrient uptake outer membrane protein [Chitinophaga lutea]|nr:RagB/SusD family nutrient uptake outer membrane protein [Chitinophaga lutea]